MVKKFIGNAIYTNGDNVKACLYSGANSFSLASSVITLANQHARELGEDWREKTTFERPTAAVMFDHAKPFHLQELTFPLRETFENAMRDALNSIQH